ncbi:hypothetical protein CDIK_3292 [Cucumispora dikerogammari]|nr:hypothetical protein CDIK_3292 [Cucumispora dikerogammari]
MQDVILVKENEESEIYFKTEQILLDQINKQEEYDAAMKYFLKILSAMFDNSQEDTEKFCALISVLDSEYETLLQEVRNIFPYRFFINVNQNNDKFSSKKETISNYEKNTYENDNVYQTNSINILSGSGDPPKSSPPKLRGKKLEPDIIKKIKEIIK